MSTPPVCFEIVHPESGAGEYGSKEDPSPFVHLADITEAIDNMLSPDEVVISKKTIRLKVTYPLACPYITPADAPDGHSGFTRAALVKIISSLYHWIYDEEERTSTIAASTVPGMFNRTNTAGRFGIWGHDLGDLALEAVWYNSKTDVYELGISS